MSEFSFIPKHCLLLHYPWVQVKGATARDVAGPLNIAGLIRCTEWSELDERTPEVSDCFLTIGGKRRTFSYAPYDLPGKHQHSITHFGRTARTTFISDITDLDEEDMGGNWRVASPDHYHTVELKAVDDRFMYTRRLGPDGDSFIIEDHEPRHFEVNAYYAEAEITTIPAGSVVFFDRHIDSTLKNQIEAKGWIALNLTELPVADNVPSSRTKWENCYVKITTCTPKGTIQGSKNHEHNYSEHRHGIKGIVMPVSEVEVDDSSGAATSSWPHSHDGVCSLPLNERRSRESNDPKSVNFFVLIAVEDDAQWEDGMIIPFIPIDIAEFSIFPTDSFRELEVPVGSSTGGPGEFYLHSLSPSEKHIVKHAHGQPEHTHQYWHEHEITLTNATAKTRTLRKRKGLFRLAKISIAMWPRFLTMI